MLDGKRDINKCLTFLSLKSALRQSKDLFEEPEITGNHDQALSYLMYLYLMGLLEVPVKLNGQGKIPTRIIRQKKSAKYFEALRQYNYIQIKKFPGGTEYVWITPRGKKTLSKLIRQYEENIADLSEKFKIRSKRQLQW